MKLSKSLSYSIILISISSVLAWCDLPIGNTFLWWLLDSWILFNFYLLAKQKGFNNKYINYFLIILGVSFIYGATFQTENYWDWKLLISNLIVFLMSLAAYSYSNPSVLSQTLNNWFIIGPLILLALSPFLHSDAYGKILVPYTLMALWIQSVPRKFAFIILLAFIVCLTLGNQARGDMLKFTYCILLGGACFFSQLRIIIVKCKKVIWLLQIVMPIVLFIFAITGVFNVFSIQEELGIDDIEVSNSKEGEDYNGLADTRTFLYIEEITSAIENDYVFFGRSMARGYDSESIGNDIDADLGTSRGERQDCEVSILNVFNYFGLLGVFVYALIFITSSYRAVNKSNNRYIQIVGIYISFRWAYSFIEDFTKFDLNYLFLWIMIGMCFSEKYRILSDEEFQLFIRRCIPIK